MSNPALGAPPLPDPIPDPVPTDDPPIGERFPEQPVNPGPPIIRPPWRFRSLQHGCWLIRFTPFVTTAFTRHKNGVLRVERTGSTTTASGDLYRHQRRLRFCNGRLIWTDPPEPNPARGCPTFPHRNWSEYLRVTKILQGWTTGSSFDLEYERHTYDATAKTWSLAGTHKATMEWTTAPPGYPNSSAFLAGDVKDETGKLVGCLTMGWVSRHLRKATIELESVAGSEIAEDNGAGLDWQDAMDQVSWDVTVVAGKRDIAAPSGNSWSDAEMHAAMLANRSGSIEQEWRYHLIHVRQLDSTSRGIMYDAYGGDSNNIPREGAGISTHWQYPSSNTWGTMAGTRFGAGAGPFFRTAVHELGHAFGLHHNTASDRFMNTTPTIAGNPGVFPTNIVYEWEADDARKLRHWPDPRVRPGGIPFGQSYAGTPLTDEDDPAVDVSDTLPVEVTSLLDTVPLGAPVRVDVAITNTTDDPLSLPADLGLKTGFVSGRVTDAGGTVRRFSTIVHCIDDEPMADREPGEKATGSLTLLRGPDGALFPSAGMYRIEVDARWDIDEVPVWASGESMVMVTGAENADHASAAMAVLAEPDLLLTVAIGGDHLHDGLEALERAMDDPVLAPHYAVTKAKQVGRRFQERRADAGDAAQLITEDTVMSGHEMASLAAMAKDASSGRKKTPAAVEAMVEVLKGKVEEVTDDPAVIAQIEEA